MIHQRIKGEDTVAEVMKHKKGLVSLKMSEDEANTVYNFSLVVPILLGGKITTKSEITYLSTYGKCIDTILQTVLGYDLEKMLDPVHRDINLIITEQYQRHPFLKVLATEMDHRSVEFISDLVRWVDDTY